MRFNIVRYATVTIAGALLAATSANAAIAIDGSLDADYGAAKSTVTYVPGAPESNFDAPTPFSDTTGYSIYLSSDANNVYGYLQATTPQTNLNFANLYFDLDPQAGNGSDIGFEITNDRAFVAGGPAGEYSAPLGISFFQDADTIEFSISNAYFTNMISGLTYFDGQGFPNAGDSVTLRLSQSFGYSVAGGATYGPDRLGSVIIGGDVAAVPEASSWAMMITGLGLAGIAARRRRKVAVAA